ncbi:hypothetical protein HYV85_03120 [Candidatus Woesearchaeota archaeon]|nr:hypothetical protein [Candidatus Woesearchaeota archaeon]
MTPIVKRENGWGEDGWCAVVQKEPGQYAVVPCFDMYNNNRPWPEDGSSLRGTPHILVRAGEGVTQNQLYDGLDGVIKTAMEGVAGHKGWAPPKLETLAGKIKVLPSVAHITINPEGMQS